MGSSAKFLAKQGPGNRTPEERLQFSRNSGNKGSEAIFENPGDLVRAHSNGGVQQRTLLRRVLETAFEKVLRRVLRRCLAVGFNGKKGSEKGS